MMENNCFYCDKNEKLDTLMIKICELPNSIVYLNRDQKHKGRCIVAFKAHKTEYFQLTPAENAGYFAEVATVAQAIDSLYHPDKLNYATFGDSVPHVHVHLVPKYRDQLQWGEAFHDDVPKLFCDDAVYQEMIVALRQKIQQATTN